MGANAHMHGFSGTNLRLYVIEFLCSRGGYSIGFPSDSTTRRSEKSFKVTNKYIYIWFIYIYDLVICYKVPF